ncbi:eukaryotic translation initiation factor 4B isoform X2 [Anopheles darlingi]|uniref:eukaryotic translation initiation factor 4B isoform X2 n=1 Tax=Anopheles darlingi TaxID=43151 RepID=UPI00210038AF|nr:eukaryotic translation initiation factor 4B isoform X2 [Anopheles darlingi]
MATVSGKKGKKTKKNKLSLGEFLTDGNTGALNQVQISVPVKLSGDWGDDVDDDDDERSLRTQVIALPTAPRATRIMNDDSIPHHPPFSIYVSNLPYDINDEDLYDFFPGMDIVSMSLPRDDGDSRRLRGFGNIEFASRNDLINVLAMPEPIIRNRRIRIGLYNENDTKRRNNRYDNFGGGDSERGGSDNWRDRPDGNSSGYGPRGSDGGNSGMRRYNNYNRDRDEQRDRPDSGGNWRAGDRPAAAAAPVSPNAYRRFGSGGPGGDRDRDGGFMRRNVDRTPRRDHDVPMERPKLVLQPRTLPIPERQKPSSIDDDSEVNDGEGDSNRRNGEEPELSSAPRAKPTPVPAAKVFGAAKPVDTAAREREIEERLQEEERKEREERQRKRAEAAAVAGEDGAGGDNEPDKENVTTQNCKNKAGNGDAGGAPEEIISWRVRNTDDEKDDRKTDNHREQRGDNRPVYRNTARYQRNSSGHEATIVGSEVPDTDTKQAQPKERDVKMEDRMPKFHEPIGPNLSVNNTFEGLTADDDDIGD